MAVNNKMDKVMHRVRVKLYPNYLPGVEGAYIARTSDEASLNVAQVCAAMKNRGGFTGNYDDLVEHVNRFLDEAAYQLCDGYAVNNGYFSLHPKIGGTFDTVNEEVNAEKHPLSFAFHTRAPLRDLARHIEIVVEGVADVQGYIDEVLDVRTGAVNESLTPGGQVVINGSKIKVTGDNPAVGIALVGTDSTGTALTIPFVAKYAENAPVKIITLLPDTIPEGQFVIKITTQYTSGDTFLKEPRVVSSCPFNVAS